MAESLSTVSEVKTPERTAVKNDIVVYRFIVRVERLQKVIFLCLRVKMEVSVFSFLFHFRTI